MLQAKKVLFLTQYFPPEVGAPQNRLFEIAVRLQRLGCTMNVLTAMPNYPSMEIHKEYKGRVFSREKMEGIDVYRTWIYSRPTKSLIPRLINYYSFAILSFFRGLFLPNPEIIFVESPPLFLGKTAWLLAKLKGAKLVFNVSDLWPESAEKLGLVTNQKALKIATMLEEFLYRNSDGISGQTQGIVKNIQDRFPNKQYLWLPNGADLQFYNPNLNHDTSALPSVFKNGKRTFFYGGIIGHAQGLELLVDVAEHFKNDDALQFVLLGSGPEKEGLQELVRQKNLTNVFFEKPVDKALMPAILSTVEASVIPLKRLDIFKGAIPSKIFEALAMEKTVLLGVEGEAKELFVDQAEAALFFEPENTQALIRQIEVVLAKEESLHERKVKGRKYVQEYFSRDKAAERLLQFFNEI